jgi:hypothetical protein
LTPEGFVFGSDPSHLERIDGCAKGISDQRIPYRSQATVA